MLGAGFLPFVGARGVYQDHEGVRRSACVTEVWPSGKVNLRVEARAFGMTVDQCPVAAAGATPWRFSFQMDLVQPEETVVEISDKQVREAITHEKFEVVNGATFCMLVLTGGFPVTGSSAHPDLGREYAFKEAVEQARKILRDRHIPESQRPAPYVTR